MRRSWSIPADAAGGADGAAFAVTSEGMLSLVAAKDFEAPDDADGDGTYEVTVSVTAGTQTATAALSVTLSDVDEPALAVTTAGPFTVAEGETAVAALAASDTGTGATAVWSIPAGAEGGADGAAFAVTSEGVLSLVAAKDFEAPDDADGDGTYEVTVAVAVPASSMAGAQSATAALLVTLSDVNEAPVAQASASPARVREGARVTLDGSASADPDAGDTLTYLWTQADDGAPRVTLSDASAEQTAFTSPSDLAAETELAFTLRVTDADGLYAEDTLSVAVTLISEVSISAASNYAAEGAEAVFRLTRAGSARAALTVPVTVEETGAMLGTAAPADATFAAGARETELRVPTAADAAPETDSRVTARLASGSGWQLAPGAEAASVTVLDDDAAPETETAATDVTIWSADMTVVEYSPRSIGAGSADLFSNQMGRAGLRAKYLWYDPSERVLRLGFDAGLYDAEPLTLHVGDVSLGFSENPGGDASFTLEGVDLSWTDGETLEARISKPSASAVSTDATLASLGVEGATLSPAFDARVLLYWAVADAGAGAETVSVSVSVSAQANDDGATVAYGPAADADAELADHQVAAPTGGEILVVVTVTAADGTVRRYRVVVAPTAAESNTAPTGAPTISGTPQVGETLTADTSAIADRDGLANVSYSYQWIRSDGNNDTDIPDATDTTYTLTVDDVGKTIQVRVTFTDDGDNQESLISKATVAVAATVATAPLSLTVTPGDQIQELDASWQAPSSNGGSAVTGYKVQWKESADSWDTEADVSESTVTGTTHTITGLTGGVEYAVRVIATTVVGDGPASVEATGTPMGAPTISGTAQVGQTLMADTTGISNDDGLANVSYSYQWIRSDNGADTDIAGETDSTYTLLAVDVGKTLKVRVSFTDDAENAESLTSGATEAVTRPPSSRAPEMDGISIHGGMLRISAASLPFSDSNPPSSVPAADVGEYIASFKVQWKSGSQEYDASRQAVVAPEPVTANVAFYAFMPAYDITGLTNDVEYTVRVIATNAGGDGPPSQEQTATPGTKSEELWKYIEDEIVEEHEVSHQWLRQTLNYLRNNNIPLIVWTDASDPNTVETYSDDSSELDPGYVESLNFPVSIVDGPEATKKETILINLAYIYTMTNGVSSSPAPLGIAHVYFSESFLNLVSTNGACWESRLYLDVVVSLVLNDSLAGASDWNRCMARSEDATALAVVRSALSGQTPAWFADTYNDSEGNPDLDRLWSGVQIIGGGHERVVAYQLRNSFGGYCDSGPDWGLRISRSLSRALASAGFDTLVNPWRDGGCVPSAPISLTANLEGDGAASVSWEAPESNGGSLLSGYRIQWQSVDAEEGTTPQTKHVYFDDYSDEARPTEVSETIKGLTDGVEYKVRVLAYNPNGDGTAAEVTVPEPNAAPTGLPEISGTPQVGETLTADTSPIADEDGLNNVSYSYQWIRNDVSVDTDIGDATDSTYTPSVADADKTIKVRVSFSDDAGNDEVLTSAATGAVAVVSPGPPVIGPHQWTDYRWDHREIWIAWSPPIYDGGAAVTGYDLRYIRDDASDKSDDNWTYENGLTGTSYTVDDLTNGVMYNIQVRAVNRAGSGAWSATFSETPRNLPPDAYDVTVTPGNQTLTVEWSEPPVGAQGGVAIANYVVVHIRTDVPDHEFTDLSYWTASDIIPTSGPLSYTITGLTNGGSYFVKVRSINALGDISYPSFRYFVLATPNSRATGLPTITGTPQVGQTLTADTSNIADEDGLNNMSYSYQWIQSDNGADTDIAGETDSTYTLVLADVGKTIQVKVNFTDDADNQESLTSEATVAVATTVPTAPLSLTVTPGDQIQELDASWQAPSSDGGSAITGYKVQWKGAVDSWDTAADVSEATETGTTHTITSLTGGVEYAVRVIATNVAGDGPASTEARATPADSPASGEEGTETVESDSKAAWTATLTVGVSGSGSEEAVWGYSWFLDGMGTLDERTYSEGDQTIEVMAILLSNGFVAFNVRPHPSVDFVLTVDGTEFASADASEVKSRTLISHVWATTLDWAEDDRVALSLTLKDTESAEQSEPAENTPATGLPTISGTPQVDRTLTADTTGISDADGLDNVDYSFQWVAGGADISGATGSSYLLTTSEQGQTIQVKVTFTDDADNQESLTSAETLAVAAKPNTTATGEPTISGTPQVRETLTADTSAISDEDGLDNVAYRYQWLREDAEIAGQTNSTYELVSADEGKTIKVRVTFNDDAGNAESLNSTATTAVAAQPTPAVFLTASFANVPADHNGGNFTFDLTFSENVDAGYARIRDHAFTVTGGSIASASRITQGSNQGWNIEVNPIGNDPINITLPETTDCDAARAICTDDSRKLSHPTSATVAGPPAISISDATVQEADGAVLEFSVTLSHASSRTVTVDYATSDGTAVAGSDYTAASGALTFNAGDTSQTVQVTVLTDQEDESDETLTLTLSNPSQATLADATGTGTIEDGESSSGTQEDPPADTPVVSLTATFANMPGTHDGTTFTFDLSFSENVKAGYARIRDHAFTISGNSTIASAVRKTQGSNQNWTITVKPDGNGAITITLPETSNCDATGAICTYDGRKLSDSTSAQVAGPA